MRIETKKEQDAWKKGYESGVAASLRQHSDAIAIGRAVLQVLDNRYEFKQEDY